MYSVVTLLKIIRNYTVSKYDLDRVEAQTFCENHGSELIIWDDYDKWLDLVSIAGEHTYFWNACRCVQLGQK